MARSTPCTSVEFGCSLLKPPASNQGLRKCYDELPGGYGIPRHPFSAPGVQPPRNYRSAMMTMEAVATATEPEAKARSVTVVGSVVPIVIIVVRVTDPSADAIAMAPPASPIGRLLDI